MPRSNQNSHLSPETAAPAVNRSTGPTSPAGKAQSSQNALKHGSCSTRLILPGESREQFHALLEKWLAEYQPASTFHESLVLDAAEAEWLKKRNEKNFDDIQFALAAVPPLDWSPQQHHQYGLFYRYSVTAERAFHRALRGLEHYRHSRGLETRRAAQDAQSREKAQKTEPLTHDQAMIKLSDSIPRKPILQLVSVKTIEGVTHSEPYPDTETLRRVIPMQDPRTRIQRRFEIYGDLPPEYEFLRAEIKPMDGFSGASQLMTQQQWWRVIEREDALATGHMGPIDWLPPEADRPTEPT